MKKFISILLAIAILFSLTACADIKPDSNKISIISSIFPSYDFAKKITDGIDGVEVSMLITPGTEPHSYEPGVRDMAKIKECDLFIYLGGESDEWVASLLDTFNGDEINTLKMTDCVKLLEEEEIDGAHHHSHDTHEEAHGENDEHVWTSPANAILISEKIADKLCGADPRNAEKYKENFDKYKAELSQLDSLYKEVLTPDDTLIIADRFPFRYLEAEYGFKYYAAFPGCSTENDPSAATIAFLDKKIRATGTKAVFYTEFSSQKVADTLCEATGVKKLMLHSCHNVSKRDFDSGISYVYLMKQNLKNIEEALK